MTLNPDGAEPLELPSMSPYRRVTAGDVLRLVAPSGGGYGDPLQRDPALVRADVVRGIVSREAALADYGVVLGDGPAYAVDAAATADRRAGASA